jgi:hypothetical protein
MSKKELDQEGWESRQKVPVLVFSDGTLLYPSQDGEGNGPGELFGITPDGSTIFLIPD